MKAKQYFTFAMTMPAPWEDPAAAERFVKAVSSVEGFYGVHPEYPYVMAILETLESAIRCREIAMEMGERVADHIMYARVDKKTGTLKVDGPAWKTGTQKAQ